MFFLQFTEFNLKEPPYSKTLITQDLPYSRAPTLFSSNYSQFWLFFNFFFTSEAAIIKGAIYSIVGGYSEEPWCASHRMQRYFIPVSVSLRVAMTLLKRLLSKNLNFNSQITHASRQPGAYSLLQKFKILLKLTVVM